MFSLAAKLNKEIVINKILSRSIGIAAFAVATSLGAFVRVPLPFTPVPLTLQTFFVLLAGVCLGSKVGAFSQVAYLAAGLLGFSVFTGVGSGPLYLIGPTGGYLLGFVLAAFFTGKMVKSCGKNRLAFFCSLILADLLILACGMLWLKIVFGYSLDKLLLLGFLPFVAGDILKISAVAALYAKFSTRLEKIF